MIGGKKKCIGLIFGGNSNEHEVSISSAKTVYKAFNSEKILIDEIENNKTKKEGIFNQEKINFLQGIEFQNVDVWFPLLD